eukprot:TRINITY_DN12814_c0_g1_i1.p1 TRINITY_DN12814_c0_g1~~TRINITY_DN12814_c0_g1_i1.p1  ORF type:complete len:510 (-),score=93.33 TRINITY_DN12814_c0_g1_i1:163-1692(-)
MFKQLLSIFALIAPVHSSPPFLRQGLEKYTVFADATAGDLRPEFALTLPEGGEANAIDISDDGKYLVSSNQEVMIVREIPAASGSTKEDWESARKWNWSATEATEATAATEATEATARPVIAAQIAKLQTTKRQTLTTKTEASFFLRSSNPVISRLLSLKGAPDSVRFSPQFKPNTRELDTEKPLCFAAGSQDAHLFVTCKVGEEWVEKDVGLAPEHRAALDVAFSPDGKLIATTSGEYVNIWTHGTATGYSHLEEREGGEGGKTAVAFAIDRAGRKLLALCGPKEVELYRDFNGKFVLVKQGKIKACSSLTFFHYGDMLLTGGAEALLWNTSHPESNNAVESSWEHLFEIDTKGAGVGVAHIKSVVVSKDESVVVLGRSDGKVLVSYPGLKNVKHIEGLDDSDEVNGVTISADNSIIAVAGGQGVHICNTGLATTTTTTVPPSSHTTTTAKNGTDIRDGPGVMEIVGVVAFVLVLTMGYCFWKKPKAATNDGAPSRAVELSDRRASQD